MWIVLSMNSGTAATSACQAWAKVSRSASCQWVWRHRRQGNGGTLHRPDQPDAALHLAVVEHQARRRDLHGGAARLAVDQKARARIGEPIQRLNQRDRLVALALRDREQARFRGRAGMGVDRLAVR